MSTQILFRPNLSGGLLDDYLAQGWRPLGQRMYSCDWLQMEPGDIYSVYPMRLPLQDYCFPKRMQKLWRKNQRLFTARVGEAAYIDVDKERVNNLYALEHGDKTVEDLSYHLRFRSQTMFDTRETRIYDGDDLVAFSFYDRGEQAAYSKMGLYHPAYRRHSLGMYSMLLEIQDCQARGMAYYYPGYTSPENPLFDYKHRIGSLEYFHPATRSWRPWTMHHSFEVPLANMAAALQRVVTALHREGRHATLCRYPFYNLRLGDTDTTAGPDYLDTPLLIELYRQHQQYFQVITYDLAQAEYTLYDCMCFRYLAGRFPDAHLPYPAMKYILEAPQSVYQTTDATEMARYWSHRLAEMIVKP